MRMSKRICIAGLLCLAVSGCSKQSTDTEKGEVLKEQDVLFAELNAACKKSTDRKNLQIDSQYAGFTDLDCQDGELVEIQSAPTRNITAYDFENNRSITHFYAMEAADPQAKDRIGFAWSYLNGYYVELSFQEEKGNITYKPTKREDGIRKEENPYVKKNFEEIVRDIDKEYFRITKDVKKDETIYTLTLADKEKTKQRSIREAEERGEDILNRNGCELEKNETIDQRMIYHVDQKGYLTSIDATITDQIDDIKKIIAYTAYYETYDDFYIKPFEDALK